jgi:hypothetical protein
MNIKIKFLFFAQILSPLVECLGLMTSKMFDKIGAVDGASWHAAPLKVVPNIQ